MFHSFCDRAGGWRKERERRGQRPPCCNPCSAGLGGGGKGTKTWLPPELSPRGSGFLPALEPQLCAASSEEPGSWAGLAPCCTVLAGGASRQRVADASSSASAPCPCCLWKRCVLRVAGGLAALCSCFSHPFPGPAPSPCARLLLGRALQDLGLVLLRAALPCVVPPAPGALQLPAGTVTRWPRCPGAGPRLLQCLCLR